MISAAISARETAHAPYSGFRVGACLETKRGTLYSGCNIENASYPATNCAERTAIFKAVSEGEQEFRRIVIVGGGASIAAYCPPCGICLQVMMEFCDPDTFEIVLAKSEKDYQSYRLKDLLPKGFGPSQL